MDAPREFHYRLPPRARGWRPGAHRGASLGAGHEFVAHGRLADWPDPRRLDLRASLRTPGDDWLVRVHRQRVGIAVQAVVDVSASMRFGATRTKLEVAADFVRALAWSAFRAGDAAGLLAFDAHWRPELTLPPRHGRGLGETMARLLAGSAGGAGDLGGLQDAARHLAGRQALVFLVSDFHGPLARLPGALDLLAHAHVVPMVVWDPAELEPPPRDGIAQLADAETGQQRTLWLRGGLREAWRASVAARREALERVFAARGLRPFFLHGAFDADAMTRHFMDAVR